MSANAMQEGGSRRVRNWVKNIVVFFLWLATSALGLVIVGLSRDIVLGIYARFSTDPGPASALSQASIFVMALVWLAYVFGTGEYHWKYAGRKSSWSILVWAVAIELLFLILYFVVAA